MKLNKNQKRQRVKSDKFKIGKWETASPETLGDILHQNSLNQQSEEQLIDKLNQESSFQFGVGYETSKAVETFKDLNEPIAE